MKTNGPLNLSLSQVFHPHVWDTWSLVRMSDQPLASKAPKVQFRWRVFKLVYSITGISLHIMPAIEGNTPTVDCDFANWGWKHCRFRLKFWDYLISNATDDAFPKLSRKVKRYKDGWWVVRRPEWWIMITLRRISRPKTKNGIFSVKRRGTSRFAGQMLWFRDPSALVAMSHVGLGGAKENQGSRRK